MMDYQLITKGGQLDSAAERLLNSRGPLGGDTETTGLSPMGGARLRLVQFSTGDVTFVLDMDQLRRTDFDRLRYFVYQILNHMNLVKIFHNGKFDSKFFLREFGFEPMAIADTMLMSQIIAGGDLQSHHGLDDAARVYLGEVMDKSEQSGDWEVAELSERQLEYAAHDARILVPLFETMTRHLRIDDLLRVAKLEFDCIVPIAQMELEGFRLDREAWSAKMKGDNELHRRLEGELREMMKPGIDWLTKNPDKPKRPVKPKLKKRDPGYAAAMEIYEREMEAWRAIPSEVDGLINLNSHPQVKTALGNLTGLDWFTLTTNDAVLALHSSKFPIIAKLQEYRSADKVVTSYGANWLEAADEDSRIRADFRQIGAETGRMSCANPVNLQNPPANAETRGCFVAPPGRKLVIADYSQIELRILADFSGDANMVQAYVDDVDLHQQTADLVDVSRAYAKRLNFGIPYGVGPVKFSSQAGITFDEARVIIGNHAATYPGAHGWLRSAEIQAMTMRFARTMSGRIIRFTVPDRCNDYREVKKILSMVGRNGKNGPIQGTSADITKRAVRLVFDAIRGTSARIVNIVHDEIVVEVDEGEAERIARIVESAMVQAGEEFITRVPVKVEAKISDRWIK